MELGEKLRQARLDAGLSQRQLCGDEITRNMLSLIENGTAKPSMKTLGYLAGRLGKPVSFFLEETAVLSPNQQTMQTARQAYDAGNYPAAAEALMQYQSPDNVYDREQALLWVLTHLALADQAIEENRDRYALELIQRSRRPLAYCAEAVERQRLLLLGRLREQRVSAALPSLDEELLLRAREALPGHPRRVRQLLEAAEDHCTPQWQLLRGQLYFAEGAFELAAGCLLAAEEEAPAQAIPLLEQCFRELGDYKRAYEYACKQK